MNLDILNTIILDPHLKGSINYAKAREAINATAKNRREKRDCKAIVIEHLRGKHCPPLKEGLPPFVEFPDSSKARF